MSNIRPIPGDQIFAINARENQIVEVTRVLR
jgi:hypothetical protein